MYFGLVSIDFCYACVYIYIYIYIYFNIFAHRGVDGDTWRKSYRKKWSQGSNLMPMSEVWFGLFV